MSGRGETDERRESGDTSELALGQPLFTADGTAVGVVRGVEERGVFVTTRDGVEARSVEHARAGHAFGEAELVWRCTTCGELGPIEDELPATCPNCDAPREALMYWTED